VSFQQNAFQQNAFQVQVPEPGAAPTDVPNTNLLSKIEAGQVCITAAGIDGVLETS
jgi:hypothetical protein